VDAGRRGALKRWSTVRTKTVKIADLNPDQQALVRALVAAARQLNGKEADDAS
jgi:hypothetical protein